MPIFDNEPDQSLCYMSFGFTDVLLCFLIFQLLFISLFLVTLDRGKRISNGLLGSFFAALGLNLLDTLLLVKGVYFNYPAWGLWGTDLVLLFGPLLWLHTKSVIYRDFRPRWYYWLHGLPFVLLTTTSLAAYHEQPIEQQRQILRDILDQQLPAAFYMVSALILAHFFTYLLVSLRLLSRYKRALTNQFSAVQNKNLSWLSYTLLFFLLFFLLSLVRTAIAYTPLATYELLVLIALLLALLWFINRFLLRALRSPELFAGLAAEDLENVSRRDRPASHDSDGRVELPASNHTLILNQLANYMATHKPYLEPELTLDQLASRLGVRPKVLSVALNEGLGQHFFDYINRYRIDEAKRLLSQSSDAKLTVLEVLYQVGFNSKSSFNTLFRKYTGQTPSDFRKRANDV